MLVLSFFYLAITPSVFGQSYSTIYANSSPIEEIAYDLTCNLCDGKKLVASLSNNSGVENLNLTLHLNGGVLNSVTFPDATNPVQFDFDNRIRVKPIFDISGNCSGYIVAVSAKAAGTSTYDLHLFRFDPNLNLLWHEIPFNVSGQSVFVKDMIIDNNTGILLSRINFNSTMVSRFILSTGITIDAKELQIFDASNNIISEPESIIALDPTGNYAGDFAVVGHSNLKTFVAFISNIFAVNDMYLYEMDVSFSTGNQAISVAERNGAIYVSGLINYFNFGNTYTYTYVLEINGANGFIPIGEVFTSRYYALPFNGSRVRDMVMNTQDNGLILAGQSDIVEDFAIGEFGTPFMMELDLAGNVNWAKDYNTDVAFEGGFYQLDISNNDICACGMEWQNSFSIEKDILNVRALPHGVVSPNCERDITVNRTTIVSNKIPLNYAVGNYPYASNKVTSTVDPLVLNQTDCFIDLSNSCNAINAGCLTNTLILNTGFNPITQTLLPPSTAGVTGSSQDPGWILTGAPTNNGPVSLNSPAFVISTFGSWDNMYPNPTLPSRYISAFQNNTNNAANLNSALPPYTFERKFCICEDNTTITIDDSVHVDNWLVLTLEGNGITPIVLESLTNAASTSNFLNPPASTSPHVITLNQGTYKLVAKLRNGNTGSAMGLNIQATIVADKPSLVSEVCCNSGSYVSGYKFLDNNCNGTFDGSDQLGIGWTINLKDPSGTTILQSTTTDINGYYSFNIPTPGNYKIEEIQQGGYDQFVPSGNQPHNVTVTGYDVISNLNFANCPCTEVVGSINPPAWIDYGFQLTDITDLVYYDGSIVALYQDREIYRWDPLTNAWIFVYQHPIPVLNPFPVPISDLEVHNVNGTDLLFFGGEEPGYFSPGGFNSNTPILPVTPSNHIISDFEVINGVLFAGGFIDGATTSNIGIVTVSTTFTSPMFLVTTTFNDGHVFELGQFQGNMIAIGNFAIYPNIVELDPGSIVPLAIQPFTTGLNFIGTTNHFDIVDYQGSLHVGGSMQVTGLANTDHYAVFVPGTGWLNNTGISSAGPCTEVYELEVYSGYLYIGGCFESIAGASILNGSIYDGSTYKSLGNISGIIGAMLYVPNYNPDDVLAIAGETPFMLGKCGGINCYAEIVAYDACVNEPIQFQSYSFNPGSCSWDFGDTNTSLSCNPVHQYASPGSYTVTMTHDDGLGCNFTATYVVNIDTPLDASFTYTTTGLLVDPLPVINTADQYNYGDGSGVSVFDFHYYSSPGTYTVCHQVFNNGCMSESCETINVCDQVINLFGDPITGIVPDGVYHAGSTLNLYGTIPTGGNVILKAGAVVAPQPGSFIAPGANCTILIEPCN